MHCSEIIHLVRDGPHIVLTFKLYILTQTGGDTL